MSIHRNAVGVDFEWTVLDNGEIADLSAATVKKVKFVRPDDTQLTGDIDFSTDGFDGKVRYQTPIGLFSVAGKYQWQLYLEISPWKDHSDSGHFMVGEILYE